jgi:gliding motility-associated-like protein
VSVLVTIQNTPAPTGNGNQSFCSTENATLNNITLNGINTIWYDSLTGTTILPTSTLLQNGVTYYASQTINGCESQTRLAVSIQLINTLNANDYSETLCDDLNNGFETANLSNYNSLLIASPGNVFKFYNSLNGAQNQITSDEVQNSNNYNLSIGNNIFYVRIESPNTCFQIVTLNLTLVRKPFININDIMPICEGSSITIDAGFGYDNYLWSTNEINNSITVTQAGNYSVTVSENHGALVCSTTKNFTVVNSNIGTISEIITSDWTQDENTISVLLSSNSVGNYEYSLNGIDFQDSNTFYGLENGEYTVFIRDKNGCGVSSEEVYLLMYPKYFTPNGDSLNDYWRIKFSENEPNLMVTIFDRYGKLMTQFDSINIGWDGTYQGNQMPSTDYWFVVKRENGKEFRGHFTLKR